jgi:NlpC/P60 family putative phage cell wall peptidase
MTDADVARLRAWLGTPYLAGASQRGVATDCVGLIEGLARDQGIALPSRPRRTQDLLSAAAQFLRPSSTLAPGCIILLAQQPGGPPVHAGIMVAPDRFIHAHWTAGVVENRYGCWFQRRTSHVFAWPDGEASSNPLMQDAPIWPV